MQRLWQLVIVIWLAFCSQAVLGASSGTEALQGLPNSNVLNYQKRMVQATDERVEITAMGRDYKVSYIGKDQTGPYVDEIALDNEGRFVAIVSAAPISERIYRRLERIGISRAVAEARLASNLSVAANANATARTEPLSDKIYLPIESLKTVTLLRILSGHSKDVRTVAFNPDGKVLATGSDGDEVVLIWDVSTGKILKRLPAHPKWVSRVAFSPDGKILATIGGDQKVAILWDVATDKKLHTLRLNDLGRAIAFSPDSRLIATVDVKKVVLWDVATGKNRWTWKWSAELSGLTNFHVAFSPDGTILATGYSAGKDLPILIDVVTGKELGRLVYPTSDLRPGYD